MTRRRLLTVAVCLALAMFTVLMGGRRLVCAKRDLVQAGAQLTATGRIAQEIVELRSGEQYVAHYKRPQQDVIALVHSVLASSGLSATCFEGLSNESDAVADPSSPGRSNYRRQSVRLRFRALAPSEIGDLLAEWEDQQKLWVPTQIDLTHSRGTDADQPNQYDVSLLITSLYVGED